jgi:hypothetical protein
VASSFLTNARLGLNRKMNSQSVEVVQVLGRVAVVWLCWYAITKITVCTKEGCKLRYRSQSVLGWLSGGVAAAGIFYPIVGGAAAIMLVFALWITNQNYAKTTTVTKTHVSASRPTVGHARSQSRS